MELIFLNPITYLALIIVALQYRRQVEVERSLFGVRIHSVGHEFARSIGYGLLAGLVATILILALGITLQFSDFIIVWGITLILMLFRVRYICFAYAGGITAILAYGASFWPEGTDISYLSWIWQPLMEVNIPAITALIAILHLIEALLVRIHTAANAIPVFIEGRRGKIVGAYELKAIWFVPLLVLAPGTGRFFIEMPTGWPFFATAAGLTLFSVPVLIGFSSLAVTRTVKETSAASTKGLLLYSIILLGLSFLADYASTMSILPALFALVGHEGISLIGRWKERNGQPIYINDSEGIKILSIVPKSAADEMGLKPGEIVTKVNGIAVDTKSELYEAIQQQSGAFCKLQVINLEGHVKFVTRALYDGEHHQLGIISAPEGIVDKYLARDDISVIDLMRNGIHPVRKRRRITNRRQRNEVTM